MGNWWWLPWIWSHPFGARLAFYPSLLYGVLMNSKHRRWYDRIDDKVILGALPFYKIVDELIEKENIGGIVSLNEPYEMRFFCPTEDELNRKRIYQLKIPTVDFNNAPNLSDIKKAIEFIKEIDSSKSVYVHCKAGRGRSTTVVACYLIHERAMKANQAVEFIRSKRPHIALTDIHLKRLDEFEQIHF